MDNSPEKVAFRQDILEMQNMIPRMIERGEMGPLNFRVRHYFCPTPDKKGFIYARELWVAKDSVIIGKLHKHPCLNFLTQGQLVVSTEDGPQTYKAPYTFVAPAGVKRAGWIQADTIWTTVHLTTYGTEEELPLIEDQLIAKDYSDLGLIDSLEKIKGELA